MCVCVFKNFVLVWGCSKRLSNKIIHQTKKDLFWLCIRVVCIRVFVLVRECMWIWVCMYVCVCWVCMFCILYHHCVSGHVCVGVFLFVCGIKLNSKGFLMFRTRIGFQRNNNNKNKKINMRTITTTRNNQFYFRITQTYRSKY